jgi:hypothetical protein
MAPSPQIVSRDDTAVGGSGSSPVTPEVIGGLAFAGAILLGACIWLGIHLYRKRTRETRDLIVKGVISEGDEKAVSPRYVLSVSLYLLPLIENECQFSCCCRVTVKPPTGHFSRDQLTASIVLPHQNIIRPDVTKDDIMRYHMASGTMTRPFSSAANTLVPPASPMGAAMRPISIVSFQSAAGGSTSPRRTSFFGFGNRPSSVASSVTSNVSSMFGVEGRKIRQLFSPVLPDELVLSLGEKVTLVRAFDDGWCIVGRDSQLKAGDVEMGAVPAWCFVKPVKGLKASRPMRTSSLGVTVQIDAGPGFSSREECISWSNF